MRHCICAQIVIKTECNRNNKKKEKKNINRTHNVSPLVIFFKERSELQNEKKKPKKNCKCKGIGDMRLLHVDSRAPVPTLFGQNASVIDLKLI